MQCFFKINLFAFPLYLLLILYLSNVTLDKAKGSWRRIFSFTANQFARDKVPKCHV